ncbi:MAG TPA: c-type cytochrome [Telluria sp.]|jgi:cytochrome c553
MRSHHLLPAAAAILAASTALAQPAAPKPAATPKAAITQATGSAEAGQKIASAGAPNNVTACVSCHGAQGEGNPAANFPRIGGQSAYYLNKQMNAFANDTRANPIMSPIAKAMSDQQRRDTSAYYASLQAPAGAATPSAAGPRPSAKQLDRGRMLATVGDDAKQLQACANCHGPGGRGEPPAYPYLAGQHATYFTAAMGEWKAGQRKTDQSGQMPSIAKKLSDDDVAALAAFYAAQPVPKPAGLAINTPAGSSARPAVAAAPGSGGPKGSAQMPAGVGSEQGSPLTGGGQGPGGGGATQAAQPGQTPAPSKPPKPAAPPEPPPKKK